MFSRDKIPTQSCLGEKIIHWFVEIDSFRVLIKDHFVFINNH